MIVALVPVLFSILGLLLYLLAGANAKLVEVGRIVFFAAFLATMMSVATKTFRIG